MNVIVRTKDAELLFHLLTEELPEGIAISVADRVHRGVMDGTDVVTLIISSALSAPTALLANWLWSKLKGRDRSATTILVNSVQVELRWTSLCQALHVEYDPKGNEDQGPGTPREDDDAL